MANPMAKPEKDRRPVHILLVKDNAATIYLLEKTLKHRQLSYELIRYADGEQAIRTLLDQIHHR